MLVKQEQSYGSPRSLMKATNRRPAANVYNSVHLPSLRGQSQTFNNSITKVRHEDSLEALRNSYIVRESSTNKKYKNKQPTDSNLSSFNRAHMMQANMLMSMQVAKNSGKLGDPGFLPTGGMGMARQFNKMSQSNVALLQGHHAHTTSNQEFGLKGTTK